MKPELYAKSLKQRNGLVGALKIATANMKNTMPSEWAGVGNSNVFTTSRTFNKLDKGKINLSKLHDYWVHVVNVLKKQKS